MGAAPLVMAENCGVLTTQGRSWWLAEIQPHLVLIFRLNQADLTVQPLIRGMTLFVDVALQAPISWQPLSCRET
jgi:hypothetical protein